MPPVKELRWPSLIGALVWASSAGAARFDVRTAPAAAEVFTNDRRDRWAANGPCFFIACLPRAPDLPPAASGILGGRARASPELSARRIVPACRRVCAPHY